MQATNSPLSEFGWERRVAAKAEVSTEYLELKFTLHRKLLERIRLDALSGVATDRVKAEIRGAVARLIEEERTPLSMLEKDRLADEILDEVFGLGPLEPLLSDPTISDILVTTPRLVHVERAGKLSKTPVQFKDDAHLQRIIEKIVSRVGRRIDESSPMVDARLPDGSRVNAVIAPVAVDGPLLSIRRFGREPLKAADLVRFLTDAAELQLRQEHVARMEARPPNIEGAGAIRIRQLVINALRMRPDRIIVGEVRAEEALDMLQAMNTGHEGSLTTVHCNSPRDGISRLEVMVGMANANMGVRAIRQQVASAIDLFIQVSRMSDGTRRVTHITECVGMEGEQVTTQDVFVFERTGLGEKGRVLGRFKPTGIRPKFSEKLRACGYNLPPDLFQTVIEVI